MICWLLMFRQFWLLNTSGDVCEFGMQVSSYAVRNVEEYRNFCDHPKDQRSQPDEVLKVKILSLASLIGMIVRPSSIRSCRWVATMNIYVQSFCREASLVI